MLTSCTSESQVAATAVVKDGPASSDVVLDKRKCLEALASLRHAKWFQVCFIKVSGSGRKRSCFR